MSGFFSPADRYRAGNSLVHRMDARAKLVATLAFIFAATFTPAGRWEVFAAMAVVPAIAAIASELPPLTALGRSMLALPFVLVAVPLLFTRPGDALFTLPPFGWTATGEGLVALCTVLAKSWLSVAAAVVLTATTEPLALLGALKSLGVPRIIVATVMMMYRYIFVIGEEASRLMTAREARSAKAGNAAGGGVLWQASVTGHMAGSLFIRSYERSERVYAAMVARGFDGHPRTLEAPALRVADALAVAVLAALLVGVQVYARI